MTAGRSNSWNIRPSEQDGASSTSQELSCAYPPLRRVIGVELSPILSEAARQNLRRAQKKLRCGAAEVVTADAAVFEEFPACDGVHQIAILEAQIETPEGVIHKGSCGRPSTPRDWENATWEDVMPWASWWPPRIARNISRSCTSSLRQSMEALSDWIMPPNKFGPWP